MYAIKTQCQQGPFPDALAKQGRLVRGSIAMAVNRAQEAFDQVVRRADLDSRGAPLSPADREMAQQAADSGQPLTGRTLRVVDYPHCGPADNLILDPPHVDPVECGSYYRRTTVPAGTVVPIPAQAPAGAGPVPVVPVAVLKRTPSGDICRDLRDSVILQSDVTLEQLWECSQAAPRTGVIGVYPRPGIALAGLAGPCPARLESESESSSGSRCLLWLAGGIAAALLLKGGR